MKVKLELDLFMQPSQRTPIMYVDGNSRKTLEDKLKEILKSEIPIIVTNLFPWYSLNDYRNDGYNPVQIKSKTGKSYSLATIKDIKPHTKKVKITIEY